MYGNYYGRATFWTSTTAIVIYIALIVLMLVATWKVFTKADEKGWKCLIPIYGSYIHWRIGWEGEKFITLLVGNIVINILGGIIGRSGRVGAIIYMIAAVAWAIYSIVLTVKMGISMAHRFGKSTAFGVFGLVLFPIIGIPMLAFGDAVYNPS